ncbi:MAG: Fic family protein [archaeon]
MVSRLDVLLAIGLFPGLSCNEIVKKIGKKPVAYASIYKLVKKLKHENLIREENGAFFIGDSEKAHRLFWLVNFCFSNNIDYNRMVSEKTAAFVRLGLEKGHISRMPFDNKTVRKISDLLTKHGFAIVESKKPFACKIVHSRFLECLVEQFLLKPLVACQNLADCLDKESVEKRLEKEFSEYKKLVKKKITFDEIGFIYSSLHLEGNTLTLPETERLIKQNIAPTNKPFKEAQEVLDYKKALDFFIYSNKALDLDMILEFHRTAMNSMPYGAGQIRKQNVKIKGNPDFKTPNWHQLPAILDDFIEKVRQIQQVKKQSAIQWVDNAAFLHNEFQRIHPFIDGNSRTARAIFSKILISNGFPLVKIPIGFSEQYMKLTKLSKKRDDAKFALLIKQITIESIKQARKRIDYGE